MKILVTATACSPYLGSENHFGWSAIQCLARDHDLWILTSQRNRADLEKARVEGLVPDNIQFIHLGQVKPWHPSRMRARLQGWREYLNFSKEILPVAKTYHQRIGFDLSHHITFATWRVASPLAWLDIPFVFGPIGGNEQFPVRFLNILSPAACAFEMFRMLSNRAARLSSNVRQCIRKAAHVFAASRETDRLLQNIRGSRTGISSLSPAFYSKRRIDAFSKFVAEKRFDGPLRLFAGGNLEGRKGVRLALHALARAKSRGVRFRYRLGGGGPERQNLQRLAIQLGMRNDVLFGEPLSGEAYLNELRENHAFLLPSFRESAGLTMMEAMLAGCVPIVADCGGPADIVTEECGFKVPVTNPDQMVENLTQAIEKIDADRQLVANKGIAASARIASHYTEDNYLKIINSVYKSIVCNPVGTYV